MCNSINSYTYVSFQLKVKSAENRIHLITRKSETLRIKKDVKVNLSKINKLVDKNTNIKPLPSFSKY
jgi:hypothetical protein